MMGMAITLASCSGEDGLDGKNGDPGTPGNHGTNGEDGDNGISCWDLNGNGNADITDDADNEDINLDGVVDALDCQGLDGQNGQPGANGEDKPNVEFYFQDGFKGYDGTQDAQISDAFGSTNNVSLNISTDLDNPGDERFAVLRFDDIAETVNNSFETDNIGCSDEYVINQAILYLYCRQTFADQASPGYVHFGFFGPQDPLFDEESVSWTKANSVDDWFIPGAISELFVGPFPSTDNYTVKTPLLTNSTENVGWMALPLPRQVVESWICNQTNEGNKGVRIRISSEANTGEYQMRFYSSEADQVDLRPLLVIETEEVDASSKAAVGSSKKTNWEEMTYEEKMAPLHRFLSKSSMF